MKDCSRSTFKNCTSLQYFFLIVINQTLWCQLITVYCPLVLKLNWLWNLWSVVYAQIPLFFDTSLRSLSKGRNDRMLPENNLALLQSFLNNYFIILSWLAWKVCTCCLINFFLHTIKLVLAVWTWEDLQNSYYFNTYIVDRTRMAAKMKKKISWLNMKGCWCFWPCHCCVKLPISMCTSKQKPSECGLWNKNNSEFHALL